MLSTLYGLGDWENWNTQNWSQTLRVSNSSYQVKYSFKHIALYLSIILDEYNLHSQATILLSFFKHKKKLAMFVSTRLICLEWPAGRSFRCKIALLNKKIAPPVDNISFIILLSEFQNNLSFSIKDSMAFNTVLIKEPVYTAQETLEKYTWCSCILFFVTHKT